MMGFKECKRKVAYAFYLLDLSEIRVDELEEVEEGEAMGDGGEAVKVEEIPRAEATIVSPKELQSDTVVGLARWTRLERVAGQPTSVWEIIMQEMVQIEAIINTTVEAIWSGTTSILDPDS